MRTHGDFWLGNLEKPKTEEEEGDKELCTVLRWARSMEKKEGIL